MFFSGISCETHSPLKTREQENVAKVSLGYGMIAPLDALLPEVESLLLLCSFDVLIPGALEIDPPIAPTRHADAGRHLRLSQAAIGKVVDGGPSPAMTPGHAR
jgi:hypothetical protein